MIHIINLRAFPFLASRDERYGSVQTVVVACGDPDGGGRTAF